MAKNHYLFATGTVSMTYNSNSNMCTGTIPIACSQIICCGLDGPGIYNPNTSQAYNYDAYWANFDIQNSNSTKFAVNGYYQMYSLGNGNTNVTFTVQTNNILVSVYGRPWNGDYLNSYNATYYLNYVDKSAIGSYIGVSGKARNIKKMYVGVDGKARKVKKVYIGVENKARLAWCSQDSNAIIKKSAGSTYLNKESSGNYSATINITNNRILTCLATSDGNYCSNSWNIGQNVSPPYPCTQVKGMYIWGGGTMSDVNVQDGSAGLETYTSTTFELRRLSSTQIQLVLTGNWDESTSSGYQSASKIKINYVIQYI